QVAGGEFEIPRAVASGGEGVQEILAGKKNGGIATQERGTVLRGEADLRGSGEKGRRAEHALAKSLQRPGGSFGLFGLKGVEVRGGVDVVQRSTWPECRARGEASTSTVACLRERRPGRRRCCQYRWCRRVQSPDERRPCLGCGRSISRADLLRFVRQRISSRRRKKTKKREPCRQRKASGGTPWCAT